jgi:hypothetical protein
LDADVEVVLAAGNTLMQGINTLGLKEAWCLAPLLPGDMIKKVGIL